MKNNIKFNYLYRDAGNYKNHGSLVFSNPEEVALSKAEELIRSALIDGEFFDPRQWGIPSLHFAEWDAELDHDWNEFVSVEVTSKAPTWGKTLSELIEEISEFQAKAAKAGTKLQY